MRIRLLKPVDFRQVGTLLDVPDGVAELWILQRKAEAATDPRPIETMVPVKSLDVDIAVSPPRRNKSRVTTA